MTKPKSTTPKPRPDAVVVMDDNICCDGSVIKGAGHPAVYLSLKNGAMECPYCGAHYVARS